MIRKISRFARSVPGIAPGICTMALAAMTPTPALGSAFTCGAQKLVGSDAGASDFVGAAAALSGHTLLLGAPWDDNAAGTAAGKVTAWERLNGAWQQIPGPVPVNPQAEAQFGRSVALAGNIAVVGANNYDNMKGTAYFFKRLPGEGAGWTQTLVHTPLDIVSGDFFGHSAAINETGDIAVFGAPFKDITDAQGTDQDAGAAYIYARNPDGTWSVEASLFDANPVTRDPVSYFGHRVAVSGEVAVISNRSDDAFGLSDCGSVRIYRRNAQHQWNLEATLFAPQPQLNAYFGEAVAVSGNQIAIGSFWESSNGLTNNGSVHMYRYDNGTWIYDGKIVPPAWGVSQEGYGGHVALSGDRVVISCNSLLPPPNLLKRAFVARRWAANSWVIENILVDPDDNNNGSFGAAVAMDGPRFVVADDLDDPNGIVNSGAGYVYTLTSDTCEGAAAITTGSYAGCSEGLSAGQGANVCAPIVASGADVWFSFTALCSGSVTIDTNGSSFDTVLSVLDNCPFIGGQFITCDDDSGIGTASQLTFYPVATVTYKIRLAGKAATDYGNFVINLTTSCPAPEPCPADIAPQPGGNDMVNIEDLLLVIATWGTNGAGDVNASGTVNIQDLLAVIAAWGACP